MSAANFLSVNATSIFACELENDFDYEDLVSNLKTELDFSDSSFKDIHELRSYPSNVVGYLNRQKVYRHITIEVNMYAIIRGGYYSGCNLDWSFELLIEGNTIENISDIDDIEDCIRYAYENKQIYISPSDCVRKSLQVGKQFEKLVQKASKDIEKLFEKYSDQYKIEAKFSNGETIYSKLK